MKSSYLLGFLWLAPHAHSLRMYPKSLITVPDLRDVSKDGKGSLFHFHIPKCAGGSFHHDITASLPELEIQSSEACYEDHRDSRMVSMLRDPRTHVLSQYFHCRTSRDHAYGHGFVHATFPEWIDSWSDHLTEMEQFKSKAFCCYYPNNLMAARFTCGSGISERAAHFHPAPMQVLKEKIGNLSFVGLVEAYPESLCLLRIRETGKFPEDCECGADSSGVSQRVSHDTHGTHVHSISDYSEHVIKKVDKLTAIDRELYEFGKKRFFDEIQAVEKTYQKRLLCRTLEFSALTEKELDPKGYAEKAFSIEINQGHFQDCKDWRLEAKSLGFPLPKN